MTAGISDKKQNAGWGLLRSAGEGLGHALVGKAATEALLQLAECHADPSAQTKLNHLEKCQKKEEAPPAGSEKTVTVGQLTQQENFRKLEGALDAAQRALIPGSVDLKAAGVALQRAGQIMDKVSVPLDLRRRHEDLQKNYRREGVLQSMAQFREEHRGDPVYEGYTEAQWQQLSDHFATEAEKGSVTPGNRINLDLNADTVSERKFSRRAEANAWFLTGSADMARSFSPVAVVDDIVDTVETVRDTGLSPATLAIIAVGVADAVIPGKAMDAAADKARAALRGAGGFVGDTMRRVGDVALDTASKVKGKKADVSGSTPRLDSPPSSVNPDSLPVVSPPSNLPAANGPGGNVIPIQQPKPAVVETKQAGEIQQASGGENFEVAGPAVTPETASRQNNALLKAPPPSDQAPRFQPQGSNPASSAPASGFSEPKERGSHLRLVQKGHFEIEISRGAAKNIKKLPPQVKLKLEDWQKAVDMHGLEEVKKVGGFHDEPLRQANRKGQHSVRLNDGYRAFYRIRQDNKIELLEVNKHDY